MLLPRNNNYSTRRPDPFTLGSVRYAFDREALARICTMPEIDFAAAYDMDTYMVDQNAPHNFFHYRDNGADVLAVAHLDTVGLADERAAHFVDTEAGPVVFSRALDDRLGAYVILELLPALGIECDILLTVGEEVGQSTAAFFNPPKGYNWIIEFDRGGSDVVLYQYDDAATAGLVEATGAQVELGIFSDISYMEHLGIKAFNWGVGYQDYHGPRAHAFLEDTFEMVAYFVRFWADNADTHLPHEVGSHIDSWPRSWSYDSHGYDADPYQEEKCYEIFGEHDHDDYECAEVLTSLGVRSEPDETDSLDKIQGSV